MSGYFDGLMRSSGLPLGDAPVLGRPSRREMALPEIDAAVPAAQPLVGPLEIAAQTIRPVTTAAPPTTPVANPGSTGPISAPAIDPVGQPTSPPRQAVPVSEPPAAKPAVSRERIIDAAMRWIADGSAREQPQDAPSRRVAKKEPATVDPVARPLARPALGSASVHAAATAEVLQPSPAATPVAQAATPTQGPRPTAAEHTPPNPPSAAAPMPHAFPRTTASAPDEEVHVSIGAIHLRVEAPTPPALQASAAAVPRPAPAIAVPPRSGLSRRALRRL